ncbi:hypothetical protein D3C79_567190 [compost metagenome]
MRTTTHLATEPQHLALLRAPRSAVPRLVQGYDYAGRRHDRRDDALLAYAVREAGIPGLSRVPDLSVEEIVSDHR